MSVIAVKRITNIVSVTQGTTTEKGVRSLSIAMDKGQLAALLGEGDLYPSGAENLGTRGFPVTTDLVFEQDAENMVALLAEAVGSLVIVVKRAGGEANQTITIANHQFRTERIPLSLQSINQPGISGVAYSSDGSTLPIAVS